MAASECWDDGVDQGERVWGGSWLCLVFRTREAGGDVVRADGVGPVSMMVGSLPIEANERMRARGLRPSRSPISRVPINTPAAPSTIPLELPPVCT